MVDRFFLIRDLLFERQVHLIIPHFANKTQMTEEKVTDSRRIANVRIHGERAIRRLKVYKVLSHTLLITHAVYAKDRYNSAYMYRFSEFAW